MMHWIQLKILIAFCCFLCFISCGSKKNAAELNHPLTFTGLIDLHQSGQSSSYNTGDDGFLRKGKEWPAPRFTDNGDGTVTDHLTGLMWEKIPSGDTFSWTDAFSRVNNLNSLKLGNYQDWRLPNRKELLSLLNFGSENPIGWLESQGFSNLKQIPYWSSTTRRDDTTNAWAVHFGQNTIAPGYTKTTLHSVLAVRSTLANNIELSQTGQTDSYQTGDDGELKKGKAYPIPRFKNNGDGTMSDYMTGLTWEQTPLKMAYSSWNDAFQRIADLNAQKLGGFSDWRLPNIIELESLATQAQYTITEFLNNNGFTIDTSIMLNARYWSSTTFGADPNSAFIFLMNRGGISFTAKTGATSVYVLAVRGGNY